MPRLSTPTERRSTLRALQLAALALVLLPACGEGPRETAGHSGGISSASITADPSNPMTDTGGTTDDGGTDGSTDVDMSAGTSGSSDDGTTSVDPTDPTDPTDATSSTTADDPPSPMNCGFKSNSFGADLQWINVPDGIEDDLVFTVQGLPDPAVVTSATLRYDGYDNDHPGEEGVIRVNGNGPIDLPADMSWDESLVPGSVDITGMTVAGDNAVVFAKGSLGTGSYYGISNVMIEVNATVSDCPEAPPPVGVERTVWYQDADYFKRHNWVVPCDDYAFTAMNAEEHAAKDCEGMFVPDGSRTGSATFAFPGVAEGNYEIQIRSRHTVNRNPEGALFVVDGEGKRINQRDDLNYTTDIWGTKYLEGDIDVVLDSTMENASDSVIWVKLVPQP